MNCGEVVDADTEQCPACLNYFSDVMYPGMFPDECGVPVSQLRAWIDGWEDTVAEFEECDVANGITNAQASMMGVMVEDLEPLLEGNPEASIVIDNAGDTDA